MTDAHEKSVHRLAERKGFRLDKVGKGHVAWEFWSKRLR